MRSAVLDIETAALPWLDLDPGVREKITRGAANGEEYRRKKALRSLSPYAATVVAVGLLDLDEERSGVVWIDGAPARDGVLGGSPVALRIRDERALLEELWTEVARYDRIVTFNGRVFDGPFLSVRSAVHGLAPSRNLSGQRFGLTDHVDLYEALTFQGIGSRPSLHEACVTFGIPSPKTGAVTGAGVSDAYRSRRLDEIARYVWRDVEATAALYRRLETTLLPLFARR